MITKCNSNLFASYSLITPQCIAQNRCLLVLELLLIYCSVNQNSPLSTLNQPLLISNKCSAIASSCSSIHPRAITQPQTLMNYHGVWTTEGSFTDGAYCWLHLYLTFIMGQAKLRTQSPWPWGTERLKIKIKTRMYLSFHHRELHQRKRKKFQRLEWRSERGIFGMETVLG